MNLDLPPTYLLETHLTPDELHAFEDALPSLTWDIHEAELVLGNISRRERALFELRRLNLQTKELPCLPRQDDCSGGTTEDGPLRKRRRISPSASDSSSETCPSVRRSKIIKVLKLSWLTESMAAGVSLPMDNYLLYTGRQLPLVPSPPLPAKGGTVVHQKDTTNLWPKVARTAFTRDHKRDGTQTHPPALLRETTSEHNIPMPLIPKILQTPYSCQRPTPRNPPNSEFIEELKAIKTLRVLEGDQIGVRAYSTSIATLSAYPFILRSPSEVARLPGCGAKIAELYGQWKKTGTVEENARAMGEERVSVLQLFYNIWGVGDTTARDFHHRGWRNLDDVVEYGWGHLSRVQQIGVKYYDEFLLKIPRDEVEAIGDVILTRAREIDSGYQLTIVGGYRRGKTQSGDVDVVISHPDEAMTLGFVDKLVRRLERSGHVTHTLTLSLKNSERNQAPLPWKGEGRRAGSGFDTLDKALVVWKDPNAIAAAATAPLHRRVDIIVSPWKTVGCAVLGWSGGNTFERDLRRYCKKEKGLKFDSSGIRSRTSGAWLDLEGAGAEAPSPDMETAEKRVFEGLGLTWRRPEERCTG